MFFRVFCAIAVYALMNSVHADIHLRSLKKDVTQGVSIFLGSKPVIITIPIKSIQDFNVEGTLFTPPGANYTGTQVTHYTNAPLNDASGNLIGGMQAVIACQFRHDNPMPGAPALRFCQWEISYTINDDLKSSLFFALSSMNTRANSPTVFPPGFNKLVRSYSADGILLGMTYDMNISIDKEGKAITVVFTKVLTTCKKSGSELNLA